MKIFCFPKTRFHHRVTRRTFSNVKGGSRIWFHLWIWKLYLLSSRRPSRRSWVLFPIAHKQKEPKIKTIHLLKAKRNLSSISPFTKVFPGWGIPNTSKVVFTCLRVWKDMNHKPILFFNYSVKPAMNIRITYNTPKRPANCNDRPLLLRDTNEIMPPLSGMDEMQYHKLSTVFFSHAAPHTQEPSAILSLLCCK